MEVKDELLEKAYEIAKKAHQGQVDKAGRPYIEHPLHVAGDVEGIELKVIAMLHDVIEDTDWNKEDLIREGIPEELVEVVCLLTHDLIKYPGYMEYVKALSSNPMARKVKMADLRHNMDISRIPNPVNRDFKRLEKYKKAYAFLEMIELAERD